MVLHPLDEVTVIVSQDCVQPVEIAVSCPAGIDRVMVGFPGQETETVLEPIPPATKLSRILGVTNVNVRDGADPSKLMLLDR